MHELAPLGALLQPELPRALDQLVCVAAGERS